jgi:putative phosphoribosyl transferase
MSNRFQSRREAGELLAKHLQREFGKNELEIIALPRGGIEVAAPIAQNLGRQIRLLVVRKLGAPNQKELAIGAVASGGFIYLNKELIEQLHLGADEIAEIRRVEEIELRKRELRYGVSRGPLDLKDKRALIVDDGIATGATMEVAVRALSAAQPRSIAVAVPVASLAAVERLHRIVDHVYSLRVESSLGSISDFYEDFYQVSDERVMALLAESGERKIDD